MTKIALGMIVKDDSEEDILIHCLESVKKYVDKIFITCTSESCQRIKKLCKKYDAEFSFYPWDKNFSNARNFNLKQIPKEYPWILWLDCDDYVVGAENFQQAIDMADKNNIKAIFARYLYDVELDEKDNVKNIIIEHLRERLIKNDGTFEWVAPIHETLIEKVPSGKTDFLGFYVVHCADRNEMENSMWRNIDILEEEVMNNPQDPRPIYYLAKAYFDTKIPEILYERLSDDTDSVTIEMIKDYLRKSGWAEERAQAWEYLSMIYRERQEFKTSINCLLESFNENPLFPSTYIQLAITYVMMKDWSKAMHWVKLAGHVEVPKTTLVINPRDYKSMILEALFHIYVNTGQLEECLKVIQGLVELVPTDLNKKRLADVMDVKERNDMAHHVVKLAYYLKQRGETEQLKALINSIPKEIVNEPALVNLRVEFLPPREWNDNEIAIYCGPGWEQWSPKSLAKGIGGSEEAVIYMARELAKLGWKVTVYADPQNDAGEYYGVTYVPHYHVNWKDNFNILISWRQIGLADVQGVRAKKLYCWNHDIQNPLTYTPERIAKFDKFMFLSKWHRQNVPDLPEEKVMYTSNGVNL